MKLSLIIPIYNEGPHLQEFLRVIDAVRLPVEKELILVDDASSDESAKILREFPFVSAHQLLWQGHNAGKGSAIHAGIAAATGDFIAIQDADLEYDPNDIASLLAPLLAGTADVVFGNRFPAGRVLNQPLIHYLANKSLTMMSNLFTGLHLGDMETCYKVMRSELVRHIALSSPRFGFEPEITAKFARLNVRISELPVAYKPRDYRGGKKIGWADGLSALWHIIWFSTFSRRTTWLRPGMPARYLAGK